MDGAVPFFVCRADPEERAGFWFAIKDADVRKKGNLIGVDDDFILLARVLVRQQERVVAVLFFYPVDEPEMAAALPALDAFECQMTPASRSP